MTTRPALVFACAHLTDERLYAAQIAALSATHDCRVFAFRDCRTLGEMANRLLAAAPPRFTLIGLSLGGYIAMEVIRRGADRIERLVLLDTTAAADHEARRAGRLADIAKVEAGGIDALIPELPGRWLLHPDHHTPELLELMAGMARSIGAEGQRNQQLAMLARPDSHADLATLRVPALFVCGRQDAVTPVADHEAMRDCIPGARLEVIGHCAHLATIEQPVAVTTLLRDWLAETA